MPEKPTPARPQSADRVPHSLEPLEARIAPATLVNPTTVTYIDVDGDRVTVKITRGTFDPTLTEFQFASAGLGEQLQRIDLVGAEFQGTALTIVATRSAATGGDGFANVGYINASGRDLGAIKIDGDLGRISAGDVAAAAPAAKSLTVQSLGQFGTFTQAAGGTLVSTLSGDVGSLSVKGSIVNTLLNVTGKLGRVTVGGSLLGGTADDSGQLDVTGDIGPVKIAGDVRGGTGARTGAILSDGNIASVTVGGSLTGEGLAAGRIAALGAMGPVKIAGDVRGGTGSISGYISAASLASLTIGGSLIDGSGNNSGEVRIGGNIGPVKIDGDITSNPVSSGGGIYSNSGMIGKTTILGSLRGDVTLSSGGASGIMGPITISGDVEGGSISSNANLGNVKIGGSLIGTSLNNSGEIRSNAKMGVVFIGGDLRGGSGIASGFIAPNGAMAGLRIGGSIIGGSNLAAGSISADVITGAVIVGHDIIGGSAEDTGRLIATALPGVTLGGSLIGGSANGTGEIVATGGAGVVGKLGSLKIAGDIRGGSIAAAGTLSDTGYVQAERIGHVFVGGSIIAGTESGGGTLERNGSIRSENDIGSITIKGSIVGNASNAAILSARGQPTPLPATATTDMAIKRLTVGGRVEYANVLAGYTPTGAATNADAQIGAVTVGDWLASNLIAGLSTGGDSFFGDPNDTVISGGSASIVSRIGSIVIKGQALGSPSPADSFTYGFAAQQIGSLKVGGTVFRLLAGASNDTFAPTAPGSALPVGATRTSFAGVGDGFDLHVYEV